MIPTVYFNALDGMWWIDGPDGLGVYKVQVHPSLQHLRQTQRFETGNSHAKTGFWAELGADGHVNCMERSRRRQPPACTRSVSRVSMQSIGIILKRS